jgi:hypothetical protein
MLFLSKYYATRAGREVAVHETVVSVDVAFSDLSASIIIGPSYTMICSFSIYSVSPQVYNIATSRICPLKYCRYPHHLFPFTRSLSRDDA